MRIDFNHACWKYKNIFIFLFSTQFSACRVASHYPMSLSHKWPTFVPLQQWQSWRPHPALLCEERVLPGDWRGRGWYQLPDAKTDWTRPRQPAGGVPITAQDKVHHQEIGSWFSVFCGHLRITQHKRKNSAYCKVGMCKTLQWFSAQEVNDRTGFFLCIWIVSEKPHVL